MLSLALTLALATSPKHPWTSFKAGAWAQYYVGSTDFRRGALSLAKVEGQKITVRGMGGLKDESGWEEPGVGCPACASPKATGKRTVEVKGKKLSCDLFEFRAEDRVYRECRASGHELPIVLEQDPIGEGVGFSITATELDLPIFVSGKKLSGVRYEGVRTSGANMIEVRSSGVPGGLVMQFVENTKTGKHDLRFLEAFGLSGDPVDGAVTRTAWHPWASHPVGSWVTTKAGRTALAGVTDSTVTFEGNKQAYARGMKVASSDPTSSFAGALMVKILGHEYPCALWLFQGKDQNGGEFTRRDCVSPFARVPIYSEEKGSIAGVSYLDTWVAQTLEAPGKVGKHAVALVTFKRTQKISNGAKSTDDVVLSADVPGGTVTWTSNLELNGKVESEVTQQALDFGH